MTNALFAIIGSAAAMSMIVAVRYGAVSAAFAWITGKVRPGLYAGQDAQIRSEVCWSLLSAAIYGIPAGVIAWGWQAHGWTRVTVQWDSLPLWYHPLSVLLYLLLHDAWFYWTHRLMHWPALFRVAHAVHHASRPPTAWAAMSFHPIEALTGAVVIPVLVFILPIHAAMLGVVLSVMTVMGVTNHMGWELFPDWIVRSRVGHWLITASHHHRHHQNYGCNFGLYFRHWDHLCRTDRGIAPMERQ